jgi:AAA+ ATPase superfamily predicted ATPase
MFKSITNPYIVGNPIKTEKMFYGREDDFEYIRRKLESGGRSYIIVLSGERRSGKTSILFQILNGRLGADFIPILIDMQTMAGLKNESEFFEKFALETIRNLDESLKQKKYVFDSKDASPYKIFTALLNDIHAVYPQKKILFLIDEYELIETKSDEGSLSPNFIPFLSGILESDLHISFIFTGSKTLQERGSSFWRNLFGKSLFRNVSFLSEQDTHRLITEPVKDEIEYDDSVLNTIYRLTSGQPFYTQIVGQNIVDFVNEHERNHITVEDLEQIVNEILENPLPQMIYFWNSLPQSQMLMLSLLAEILDDPETEIKPPEVLKQTKKKKLGLELDIQIVSSILESLFHKKYVAKSNNGYSFQIDLMRQWIKRDHSIWRVMKDVDILSIMQSERPTTSVVQTNESRIESIASTSSKKWLIPAAAFMVIVVAALWFFLGRSPEKLKVQEGTTEHVMRPDSGSAALSRETTREQEKQPETRQKTETKRPVNEKAVATKQQTPENTPAKNEKAHQPDSRTLALRETMLENKSKAEEIQAGNLAAGQFSQAESAEQEAENLFNKGEFDAAGPKFTEAGDLYAQAAEASAGMVEQAAQKTNTVRMQALSSKAKLDKTYQDLQEYKDAENLFAEAETAAGKKDYTRAQKEYADAASLYDKSLVKRQDQTNQIKTAIQGFAKAVESKNIDLAPRISDSYREEFKKDEFWNQFFEVADDIHLDIKINDIDFKGNTANVFVDAVMNFSGAKIKNNHIRWKMDLGENGSQWLITRITQAN